MNRNEAFRYLTRCADDNGNHWYEGRIQSGDNCPTCGGSDYAGYLACPGSRYGRTSADCAPIAYQLARLWARKDGSTPSYESLDYAMGLVVNDSDVPERDISQYIVEGIAGADIDAIVAGYLDCQLWAGLDMDREDGGNNPPLDENYDRDDIAPEYVERVRMELLGVIEDHPLAVRMYLNHRGSYHTGVNGQIALFREDRPGHERNGLFGHDFYLTREHHGTGFWDRGMGALGQYLTDIAHAYGSAEILYDTDGVLS